jgi:hypothetical protein
MESQKTLPADFGNKEKLQENGSIIFSLEKASTQELGLCASSGQGRSPCPGGNTIKTH